MVRLAAVDGVGLRAATAPGRGRGLVLLLQGRSEFIEKYAPVADAFRQRGFAVAALDWRGQGGSDRPVGHPRKGHVADFAEYQRDLAAFLSAPELAAMPGPRIAVAHSMGGAIALRAMAQGLLNPAAAIYSAPMWGLAHGAATLLLGRSLARAACALGRGKGYAPGGGDRPYALSAPKDNVLTSDPDQAAWIAARTADCADRALGAPTWAWVRAAFIEMDALAALRAAVPSLAVAGDDDQVVSVAAIRARAARDGMGLCVLPGARHEPFFETEALRARLWRAVDAFLAEVRV